MCTSRKNPYPLYERSSELLGGRGGVLKAKILQAKYEAKMELGGGGRGAKKNLCGGSMD